MKLLGEELAVVKAADRIEQMDYPDDITNQERIRRFTEDAELVAGFVTKALRGNNAGELPWEEQAHNIAWQHTDKYNEARTLLRLALSTMKVWREMMIANAQIHQAYQDARLTIRQIAEGHLGDASRIARSFLDKHPTGDLQPVERDDN